MHKDFLGWSGIGDMSYYTLCGDPGWSGAYYVDESGAIVAPEELTPNPDFFTSVLWKNLMGPKVLDVQYDSLSNPMIKGVSLHSHCASRDTSGLIGALSLGYANTNSAEVDIDAIMSDILGEEGAHPYVVYFLTSGSENDLASRYVILNGADTLLDVSSDLNGKVVKSDPLVLPALSYGFVVFPNANVSACF